MYTIPLGKGDVKRRGKDVTLVAFSYMVKEGVEAANRLQEEGIALEIIDPRCPSPLDMTLILKSVQKTRRLIVADTGWKSFGVTAEICAGVYEQAFSQLAAPIQRIALPDANTPCSYVLEKEFYPGVNDIIAAAHSLMGDDLEKSSVEKMQSAEHSSFQGPF